ncbi:MAG: twin transmembrane helix small protein [Alphaproteobacteria bacterium]|nr:twin transmembrane helix small protein [Alphaproteobacteria bacterium]MDE2041953.1 twin transmembrane helix small protein [Alphaproteobacteria bacterium]MDE2340288.1 twin transmembrane helix small protein [Alphaproteobacteria bacterium]
MNIFLSILLIALMIGTVIWLVRGVITFLRTSEADLKNGVVGPSSSGVKQNKAMMMRIVFQAAAIGVIVVILLARRG